MTYNGGSVHICGGWLLLIILATPIMLMSIALCSMRLKLIWWMPTHQQQGERFDLNSSFTKPCVVDMGICSYAHTTWCRHMRASSPWSIPGSRLARSAPQDCPSLGWWARRSRQTWSQRESLWGIGNNKTGMPVSQSWAWMYKWWWTIVSHTMLLSNAHKPHEKELNSMNGWDESLLFIICLIKGLACMILKCKT